MKIVSFSVNNFRGISGGLEKNRIVFKDANTIFLFGQNNVGKSTFLNAYEFYYKETKPALDDFYKKDSSNKIEFELEVELDQHDFDRIQEVAPTKVNSFKLFLDDGSILKVRREYSATQSGKTIKIDEGKNTTWHPTDQKWDESNYGTIGLSSVFQSCLPLPIFIKAMPTEAEVESIVNEILAEKAKRALENKEQEELKAAKDKIKTLQEKMYDPVSIEKYKEEVNKHFQKLFPETKIEFEDQDKVKWTEDKFGKKFNIHFNKLDENGDKDDNIPSSYQKVGHGAVRTAIFALLLMRDIADDFVRQDGRKDYLVLFEEPELFLHPKLMRELRSLIYKVSEDEFPYQVLCASHSPQMIDISKPKSSLVRMVRDANGTELFQISDQYLQNAVGKLTKEELKQEMYEILRFNPFICESFYSDEVILVEGPTEEIILRGYFSEKPPEKDVFVVNCGTVTNIPFYQKIFSKFLIKYHVICDTDASEEKGIDIFGNPIFDSGIQKSIYDQIKLDSEKKVPNVGILRVHKITFEPAHQTTDIPEFLRFGKSSGEGKPFDANLYWKNTLRNNLETDDINKVPIIKHIKEILKK
jgi:predicted ATP-dependent endonuclease of OLD family